MYIYIYIHCIKYIYIHSNVFVDIHRCLWTRICLFWHNQVSLTCNGSFLVSGRSLLACSWSLLQHMRHMKLLIYENIEVLLNRMYRSAPIHIYKCFCIVGCCSCEHNSFFATRTGGLSAGKRGRGLGKHCTGTTFDLSSERDPTVRRRRRRSFRWNRKN